MNKRFAVFLALISLVGMSANSAIALPDGAALVAGDANLSIAGNILNIASASEKLDWRNFSVAAGETVNFLVPENSPGIGISLQGGSVLEIFGALRSNRPLSLYADNIYVAPGGLIDAPGLSLFAGQSVNMAGLIQGSGPLNIAAPSIFVKGPLISDGVVVQSGDYQGAGSLTLGSDRGSFSAVEIRMVDFPVYPGVIEVYQPSFVASVPEPGEWMMFMAGLLAIAGVGRTKKPG
jgi:hypothetical protein